MLAILHYLEPWFLNTFFSDPQQRIYATLLILALSKLIIFPWQLIGLLRASDKDYLQQGNLGKTRFIQLLMLLAIAYVFSHSISLIQTATHHKKQIELADEYSEFMQQAKNYQLDLRNNSTQLIISGEIEIGITKQVTNLLRKNPQISSVALNSIGGHIYEGRGLSKLFTRQGLDTYVYKQCSSACATAFSGGKKRYLTSTAKLGFHQYALDVNKHKKSVAFHDASAEQKRDIQLFESRGIATAFLKKIFNASADKMWFPSHDELIKAKFINGIIQME